MPLSINYTPKASSKSAQQKVRTFFGLPDTAKVMVTSASTIIVHNGVSVTLPVGAPDIEASDMTLSGPLMAFLELLSVSPALPTSPGPAIPSEASDEEWAMATAESLFFAGTTHLSKTTALHQRVPGTSQTVYVTCFIGPELRGACRLAGNKLSFRFTTASGQAPSGSVRKVLTRLGVTTVYDDRMTTHVVMPGLFSDYPNEYQAVFGAFYAALKPWLTSDFPDVEALEKRCA